MFIKIVYLSRYLSSEIKKKADLYTLFNYIIVHPYYLTPKIKIGMKLKSLSKKLCAALLMATLSLAAYAQQKMIAGTVKDDTGQALIGAILQVKGSKNGTVTDVNGRFSINAGSQDILVVKYLGYQEKEENVAGRTSIDIVMLSNDQELEDVVVVGYGTMKKADLTGSTVSLRSDAITTTIAANPIEALQGKSTGLAVFTNNQPGEAPILRIRGSSSINASTDPLIVVDGFPLVDADMNDISASDIESMEILKDASATAIYGSRGANGVVMITTKKGAEGKSSVHLHANLGIQSPTRLTEVLTGDEFVSYMRQAYAQQGNGEPFPTEPTVTNVDWQDEALKDNAMTQDYGVNILGGHNGTRHMFSVNYYDQEGLVENVGFEKITIHNNLDQQVNNWLKIGSSMHVTTNRRTSHEEVLNDIYRYGWPTDPVYNEDGSYNVVRHGEAFNAVAAQNNERITRKNLRFLGNFYAQIDFNKHLNYRLNVGYDTKYSYNYRWTGNQSARAIDSGSTTGTGSHSWYRTRSKLMDNILTYNNKWGNHRLTLTGVYSWQDYSYNNSSLSGQFSNMALQAYDFGGASKESVTYASGIQGNRLISWTGRLSYAFADKYLLTATVRRDGSSRFGADSKWGTFPSVGLGWRASEESFLKDVEAITNLKLRASYGITGNQEIGNYRSLSRLATSDGDSNYTDGTSNLTGYYESVGNSKLKWERTAQVDLGFDLTLFDRANIIFDYYNRNTTNLLYEVPIPSTSGFSKVMSNVGEVNNRGFEFSIDGDILRTGDFRLFAGANFTYNTNEIVKLYGDVDQVIVYDGFTTTGLCGILRVGEPVNGVYARHSMGIIHNQAELDDYIARVPGAAGTAHIGSEMYEDMGETPDGQLTVNDAYCIGSVEPKYFYGLNLGFQFKDFTFSAYGQGAWDYASMAGAEDANANGTRWAIGYQNIGSYLLWANSNVRNLAGVPSRNAYEQMFNATTNPNGTYPCAGAKGIMLSDRTNGNWNYFILKNIQLSYDLSKLVKITGLSDLTLNVNLQNFVTAANHEGYNPENGDVSNPFPKTVLFGLSTKF